MLRDLAPISHKVATETRRILTRNREYRLATSQSFKPEASNDNDESDSGAAEGLLRPIPP